MSRYIASVLLMGLLFGSLSGAETNKPIDFAKQIRPILSDNCFACHGPDETTREAGLRLDTREGALDAMSPGEPGNSELISRIFSDDADEIMPPPDSHKKLEPRERQLLKSWIQQGAEYQTHWSFRSLLRPRVPAIKHHQNVNPIDAFVLDSLSESKLQMAPQADKTTLVRRVYLDLLGVPPTPSEVNSFVRDESNDAWKNLIDNLLDDRRFGERMAVYWLDLVRYADTIGYHSDNFMEVSAYRDYVIRAFNENKPYNDFSIEQLAGDLLPKATVDQKIASGYNRLLQTTQEGGAQAKEYVAIYAADRVRNVSGVWMGLTVGCAQCHDHKYDPITAQDFYSLAAFFADIKEKPVGRRDPNLKLPTPEQLERAKQLREQIDELRISDRLKNDQELIEKLQAGQAEWEKNKLAEIENGKSPWRTADSAQATATGKVKLEEQPDGTWLAKGGNPDRGDYTISLQTNDGVSAFQLEIFPHDSFPRKEGFGRGNGNVVLTGVDATVNGKQAKIKSAQASYEQNGWPIAKTLDKDKKSGWAVDGHHKPAASHAAVFIFEKPIKAGEKSGKIEINLRHQSAHSRHLIGRFRISVSNQSDAQLNAKPLPADVIALLKKPTPERSEKELSRLSEFYRGHAPEIVQARKEFDAAKKSLQDLENSYRTTLVSEALAKPRMMRILPRGNWLDDSGEVVQPAVPQFLPQFGLGDKEDRLNRMDLAQWMFAEGNPLTARTFVNRLWSLFLGRGLSRNLDDLGGQGQPPTHPELLDWLAAEFQESGWDIKHLIRQIVTSGTYQQSSNTTPDVRAIDMNNDWFARQGRWRLDAEFVRDTALQLGGLLHSERLGGLSVKPYQPAGYWQHLNFPKRKWQPSKGNDLYRRTIYTFWCRSFLHPSLLAFDAPSREECTAQRARSNIPQQALVLLNDPMYVEASRGFATRILGAKKSDDDRLIWAFRETTSREPSEAELSVLRKLLEVQRDHYEKDLDTAKQLIDVGDKENPDGVLPEELATWTQVARAMLNLYEATSRY